MSSAGWEFRTDFPGATGDDFYDARYLRDIYLRADPKASGRVTVPVLRDKRREMFQWPDVANTVHFDHIVRHYHYSHVTINPYRIIPINPVIDWTEPHGRT